MYLRHARWIALYFIGQYRVMCKLQYIKYVFIFDHLIMFHQILFISDKQKSTTQLLSAFLNIS
jgi:hypothetical protein